MEAGTVLLFKIPGYVIIRQNNISKSVKFYKNTHKHKNKWHYFRNICKILKTCFKTFLEKLTEKVLY
jgi:hypothetical protein